jgi:6-phosphogluconolactonase (cycloisomerase 2 family)
MRSHKRLNVRRPRGLRVARALVTVILLSPWLSSCGGRVESSSAPNEPTSSKRGFLYLAGRPLQLTDPLISAWQIDPESGALARVWGGSLEGRLCLSFEGAVERSGRFLILRSDRACPKPQPVVQVYRIAPGTGALSLVQQIDVLDDYGSLGATREFLYLYSFRSGRISAYRIAATGELSLVPGSPFPAGWPCALDPKGRFVYAMSSYGPFWTVRGFAIQPTTGALTEVPGSPYLTDGRTADGYGKAAIVVDSRGQFVYADVGRDRIGEYAIDGTTGALAVVPGSPFHLAPGADGRMERNGLLAPLAGFLYAEETVSPSADADPLQYFWTLTIDGTGALSPVPGSPAKLGHNERFPTVVDSTGRFLYGWAISGSTPGVGGRSLDPSTGALTPVPGSPFPLTDLDGGTRLIVAPPQL